MLKIATFNINGIRSRLPALLEWLDKEAPDVACLQELKAPDSGVSRRRNPRRGIWRGLAWPDVVERRRDPHEGMDPIETRRGLPGDPGDTQAATSRRRSNGVLVGCLYLPNGNPQPGPKFDYKLAWFERLIDYAAGLYEPAIRSCWRATSTSCRPTRISTDPKSWLKDALLQPESRERYRRLLDQGWIDALRTRHPDERIYTFWDYFRQHWQKNSGLRIDHLLLNPELAPRLKDAGVDRWVRDRPHASDHAPTWIELDMSAKKKPAEKPAARTRRKAAAQ